MINLDVDSIVASAEREGARVYRLPRNGVIDKSSFFQAVRDWLPNEPPLAGPHNVWDALSDSLWGGFDALDAPRIVLIWPNASAMRRASPDEYRGALEILKFVADALADPRATVGRPKVLSIYVETGPEQDRTADD